MVFSEYEIHLRNRVAIERSREDLHQMVLQPVREMKRGAVLCALTTRKMNTSTLG